MPRGYKAPGQQVQRNEEKKIFANSQQEHHAGRRKQKEGQIFANVRGTPILSRSNTMISVLAMRFELDGSADRSQHSRRRPFATVAQPASKGSLPTTGAGNYGTDRGAGAHRAVAHNKRSNGEHTHAATDAITSGRTS